MYGTITNYIGTAYTGQGLHHQYKEIVQQANQTTFLKCPPTTLLSTTLNKTAAYYIKRGYDIDKFKSAMDIDETEAIYIHDVNHLYVQASHPTSLEPIHLGGSHHVISFYDAYDERKLQEAHQAIACELKTVEQKRHRALQALQQAKKTHDQWEHINIEVMDWPQHEQLIDRLTKTLFDSISLNKTAVVTNRLVSSLTAAGAINFIDQITYRMQKRYMIKGLAGTGKSTLMKAIGKEAERRGFDVLYGWCGLDPTGVDVVQIPELSVAFIDATYPHVYNPERPGDEILDLVPMCQQTEAQLTAIEPLEIVYKEHILDATGNLLTAAKAEKQIKILMDQSMNHGLFEEKCEQLIP